MKKRYWLTPPAEFKKLNQEFNFDFDPCPCPRPEGYNSLVLPWGKCNYVNPPFLKEDAPFGGPSAFARKAIEEAQRGNTSVFVLPLPWNVALLMEAGAEVRYGGKWRWLEVDSKEPGPARAQGIFIFRGKNENT